MKVSSAELPPRQMSLDIEVEQERLERAMDEAYRRLSGRVDICAHGDSLRRAPGAVLGPTSTWAR